MSASETTTSQTPVARVVDPVRGIILKVVSVFFFVGMATMLKASGDVPAGELVFFRSFFAMLPVLGYLAWKGKLGNAFRTKRPVGHFLRGLAGVTSMGLGFFALTRLPLPETTAISYATPLLIVILSAVLLSERVHFFRWTAVIVGLVGVLIVLWPRLTVFTGGGEMDSAEAIGALAAVVGAIISAFALMAVRTLVQTERTETIVTYFFVNATLLSLFTIPFGWVWPTTEQAILLVSAGVCGGVGQLLMTSSYRYADMSVIAPFEYTSLILTIILGFLVFGDVPTLTMVLGALIIVGSGIAVILRERWLGLDRAKTKEASSPS